MFEFLISGCMTKNKNRFPALLFTLVFAIYALWVFQPLLESFFDPQEFETFLNPLHSGVSLGGYLEDGWSCENSQGNLMGFFRPLVSITYMMEYPLFGSNPVPYKLVNLVIHLLCCFCVARLVMTLSRRKMLAVLSAMIFMLHPGTVVATGWISARSDLMASLFSILALHWTLKISANSRFTWKSIIPALFTLLALACKELGMANLIALPVAFFLWPGSKRSLRNTLYFLTSLMAVAIVYLLIRRVIFSGMGGYDDYTSIASIPGHIAILVSQATGAMFVNKQIYRILLYGSIALTVVNYGRASLLQWRRIGVAFLIIGAYGFQSIISDTATHYAYVVSAFTVIFVVYFAGSIRFSVRFLRPVLTAAVLLLVFTAGLITHKECINYKNKFVNGELVFHSLGNISDSLPDEIHEICYIRLSPAPSTEPDLRNIPLYLKYIDADNRCTFIFQRDDSDENNLPILVWENNRIQIRR